MCNYIIITLMFNVYHVCIHAYYVYNHVYIHNHMQCSVSELMLHVCGCTVGVFAHVHVVRDISCSVMVTGGGGR